MYVIGGGKIYEAMNRGLCEHIYLTRIHKMASSAILFPAVTEERFKMVSQSRMRTENGIDYEFLKFEEKEHGIAIFGLNKGYISQR